ncbi:putative Mitogen-activated protein kinase kinase kinase 1 [Hypsibius exemplaris]|uniref:non-specific serine/threonine protein kinase n=1 Tax=Hypsibius exemplaris TaxID=2072580 RepID=A0A9X6NQP2_HYPEX|nr:putative Mitogen-activated protein kinase kinase kinase 1 [Hypsibius exemplaris]
MDYVAVLRPLVTHLVSELVLRKLFEDTLNDISSMLSKYVASSRSGVSDPTDHDMHWMEHKWAYRDSEYRRIREQLDKCMGQYRRLIANPSLAELADFRSVAGSLDLKPKSVFELCQRVVLPGVSVESNPDNVKLFERRKELGVRIICDACCLRMAVLLADVLKGSSHMALEVEGMRALLTELDSKLKERSDKNKSYFPRESSEFGDDNDCTTGKDQAKDKSYPLKATAQSWKLAEQRPRPDNAMSKSIVLPKDQMTLVAQDGVSQYTVFKYPQLLNGILTTLAVKAIPIPIISAQKVANQVSVLDVNLGFLLRLDHPNVVRHLSLQFDDSIDSLGRRTYNIVMEFCEGTQLTTVVRNDLSMSTVVDYGEQILRGLEYLHDNNVSHRAVHGDHVMVTRFRTKSVERVRLISIPRIRELCPRENQSYNPSHIDKILPLFMPPPETDGRVGSKTDIWSFGCVMIQMITGDWPVWKSSETVKRMMPQIPDQTPPVLNEVIQQCLQLEYDKRPKARELLEQLQKLHGEVKELFTPKRQPIDNRKQGSASFFKEF